MNLPSENAGGYVNASISDVSAFKDVDFLLAHGSGDDNVHYANSAHLLDMFTRAQIRRFRFRMFTDRCVARLGVGSDADWALQRPQHYPTGGAAGDLRVSDGVPC